MGWRYAKTAWYSWYSTWALKIFTSRYYKEKMVLWRNCQMFRNVPLFPRDRQLYRWTLGIFMNTNREKSGINYQKHMVLKHKKLKGWPSIGTKARPRKSFTNDICYIWWQNFKENLHLQWTTKEFLANKHLKIDYI